MIEFPRPVRAAAVEDRPSPDGSVSDSAPRLRKNQLRTSVFGRAGCASAIDPGVEPHKNYVQDQDIDVVNLPTIASGRGDPPRQVRAKSRPVRLIGRQLAMGEPITDKEVTSLGSLPPASHVAPVR